MKVTGVNTTVVEAEKPVGEEKYDGGRYFLFIELLTDEGIKGIEERIAGSAFSGRLGNNWVLKGNTRAQTLNS